MDSAEARRVIEAMLQTWPLPGDHDALVRRLYPAFTAHLADLPMLDVLTAIRRLGDRESMPSAARIAAATVRATWDREHRHDPGTPEAPEADRSPAAHAPEAR